MKTNIIRIGNSQGVRIPKPIIRQAGLEGDVNLTVKGSTIVISKVKKPRSGWSEAFAQMRRNEDDVLLDSETALSSVWDKEEWEWK